MLVMYSQHTKDAFCEVATSMYICFVLAKGLVQAYRRGLYYPKYTFITFGWYVRGWWEVDSKSSNCTAEERARVVLHSSAAVSSQFPEEHDEYVAEPNIVSQTLNHFRFKHDWTFIFQKLSEFNNLYLQVVQRDINLKNRLTEYTNYIFPYAYQCNEATLAFAYALNKTIAGELKSHQHLELQSVSVFYRFC